MRAQPALVPPFFIANAEQQTLPPTLLSDFHDLSPQVGSRFLRTRSRRTAPGRGRMPVVFAMSTSFMLVALAGILALIFIVFLCSRDTEGLPAARLDGGLPPFAGLTCTATGFSDPVRVILAALLHPAPAKRALRPLPFTSVPRSGATTPESTSSIASFSRPQITILRHVAEVARRMHVGHVDAYAA